MTHETIQKAVNLRGALEDALHDMYRMVSLMQPKSEAEFIAVALPNLHISMHEFLTHHDKEKAGEVEDAIRKAVDRFDIEVSPLLDTRLYPLLEKAKQRTLEAFKPSQS